MELIKILEANGFALSENDKLELSSQKAEVDMSGVQLAHIRY